MPAEPAGGLRAGAAGWWWGWGWWWRLCRLHVMQCCTPLELMPRLQTRGRGGGGTPPRVASCRACAVLCCACVCGKHSPCSSWRSGQRQSSPALMHGRLTPLGAAPPWPSRPAADGEAAQARARRVRAAVCVCACVRARRGRRGNEECMGDQAPSNAGQPTQEGPRTGQHMHTHALHDP